MKFNLRKKILLGYLLVVLIIIGVAGWSVYNFSSLNDAIRDIMVENYRSVIASEKMMESLERQDSGELMFLFGQAEKANQIFHENQMQFMKYLSRAEDNITIQDERHIIDSINVKYQKYISIFSKLKNRSQEKTVQEQKEFYLNSIMPIFEEIKSLTMRLLMVNQNHMRSSQQKANDNATKAIYSTLIFSSIAILTAIIFGLYIAGVIIKPVKKLTNSVRKVAAGELDQAIEVTTKDEIGRLAEEFNIMTRKLKEYEKLNVSKLLEEKKKSEGIVKSISNPIIVTDDDNKISLINYKAAQLFDVKEKQVLGSHFLENIKNDNIFELINDTLDSGEEHSDRKGEVLQFQQDQQELTFRITTTPVTDEDGKVIMVITLLEDITKLKKVDEMKSEFVSMVSHEFRTPLTSMSMGINMLLKEKAGSINDDQKELLEVAEEDCQHLSNLVDDLLDLSKMESGEIDLEFENVKVGKIFDASIKPFEQQADEKGIELARDEEIDLEVHADVNKITWVITNLIGNALRYTEEGDRIELHADKKGHKVHIAVSDNGAGIPKEYQHKIFEKFVRAGQDRDSSTGTGLGLAISKEIVEAHGGRIWVDSEEGKGSTFTFTVKLAK
ncbi:MAG TPA: ATP-binding protein [bacterium]|nr:ATP-binding protein [bacterium]